MGSNDSNESNPRPTYTPPPPPPPPVTKDDWQERQQKDEADRLWRAQNDAHQKRMLS